MTLHCVSLTAHENVFWAKRKVNKVPAAKQSLQANEQHRNILNSGMQEDFFFFFFLNLVCDP